MLLHLPRIAGGQELLQVAGAGLFAGGVDLVHHQFVVGRLLDREEHAQRHGVFRVVHPGQAVGHRRIGGLLVVDDEIVLRNVIEIGDFEQLAFETDALVAVLAEDQRLAVLEVDDVVEPWSLRSVA